MATYDFSFAWEGASGIGGPWAQLLVVKFEGRESISGLYRYKLSLLAKTPAPPVDPADILGKRATLRIATLSSPMYKIVHGVVDDAKEVAQYPDGMVIEVTLAAPWTRARNVKRSRIFLDKTLRQIIEAVLSGDPLMTPLPGGSVDDDAGDPSYSPAEERFTWRVTDTSRLDDGRVRSYTIQYNESDHDFVARLLEEEGLSYHFENGAGRSLLVITDRDGGRVALADPLCGPAVLGREIKHFHLGARQRPLGVSLDDYNWKKPALTMVAETGAEPIDHEYPGGYPDTAAQGAPLALARAERYATEARFASGDGGIRVLSAATIFKLEHPKARYEGSYLVTALDVRGEQQGVAQLPSFPFDNVPFSARFEAARKGKNGSVEESLFRPARRAKKPRIVGTQTAVVTAEPGSGAEVNVGGPDGLSIGCVRVKFHWDDEKARHAKEPTSCWVRVSQSFAGAGQGAVWHPRVGVEVIVDFEEGDPDRPLVVGRVYNGKNLPPYGGSPVHSTHKSLSTPGAGTWNEITFDDTAGAELVYMHAGKDMTAIVRHDRLEAVSHDATMKVGSNDRETVGANETITVGVDDTLTIGVDDTLTVGANTTTSIAINCDSTIGANQTRTIGASQTITIGGSLTETVGGAVTETYKSTRDTTVTAAITETLDADRDVTVTGSNTQTFGPHIMLDWASRQIDVGTTLSTTVNGPVIQIYGGNHTLDVTGSITSNVSGGMIFLSSKRTVETPDGGSADSNFKISLKGVSASATGISLSATGLSVAATGVDVTIDPLDVEISALRISLVMAKIRARGPHIYMTGLFLHIKAFTCLV